MKCSFRYCFCSIEEEDEYCSSKCKASDRSERPSERCRCDHERCDENAEDEEDEDDDDDEEDGDEDEADDVSDDDRAIEK